MTGRTRRCSDTVPHEPHDWLGSIDDWHCPGVEEDECLAESVSKGDPYHPCVCGSMVGHIGLHNCRCGYSWRPDRLPPLVQQHIDLGFMSLPPIEVATAASGDSPAGEQ